MKHFLLILIIFFTSIICSAKQIFVLDSTDNTSLNGCTVISTNGLILGSTDSKGSINIDQKDFPLTFKSLGYSTKLIEDNIIDTVFMEPAVYPLQEVVINPGNRPVTRVITYIREYCTGATKKDTLQMYSEYMYEYFFADGKVKGFDKTHQTGISRFIQRYGRIVTSYGVDSVIRPKYGDDMTAISFVDNMAFIPYEQKEDTEMLKQGQQNIDTIWGKHYPKYIYRKTDKNFFIDCDALSDHKGHKWSPWFFKMLGMTMEMYKADWSLVYYNNGASKYNLNDFISGIYNISVKGKGKQLKKLIGVDDEIDIECYMELYPVEITYLTTEEYKEIKKEYFERKSELIRPENLTPIPPSVQSLVERIDTEIPLNKK